MKILSMAWTIYDSRLQEFCDNYSGGGLAIKNICEYIGRLHESYLFIGRFKMPELKLGNIHIVDTTSYQDIQDCDINDNEKHLKTMTYAFEKIVEELQPDIVNFHGIGELMQRCIKICTNRNIPYVYTDHLYISLDTKMQGYDMNIKWEKQIYTIPDIKVITVSTGMRNKILQDFPQISSENISVIRNGTDFVATKMDENLREKYDLRNKKLLLCAGTLNYRKNQCQIVSAFQLLSLNLQEKIKVLFCGKDSMKGVLQENIIKAGLQDKLIYAGALSSEEMKKYYSIADGLIMPSYAEGLSIAALEAITYGIPIIMFQDSECADDLNDDKVVCFANQRTDECLARAIEQWYIKLWDKQYIIRYSKQFTMERVAEEYIKYYSKQL